MAKRNNKTNDRIDVSTTLSEVINNPLSHLAIDIEPNKNELLEEGVCYVLLKYGGEKERKAVEEYKRKYNKDF